MVELEHIGQRYRGGMAILADVSLRLEAGGFYFLTGAGGAGKTALLKIIDLAEAPSRGKLKLFGIDAAGLERDARAGLRRRIGMVFQDLRLIDGLSTGDNVALPLRIAGIAEHRIREHVPELLAWVGVPDRADMPVATLSGGERQLVAVARAIVRRPELLIADEPVAQVDEAAAVSLIRIFERLNDLGTTVLIATRDIAFARRFAHRRFLLDQGMISDATGVSEQ